MTRAERNIAWLEKHLCIPEGRFMGKPLVVADFMREDLKAIYDNPHDETRSAIITRPRKNAKTMEAAFIVLLHLVGPEAGRNEQLYSAAESRDQAATIFDYMVKMINMSPTLKPYITILEASKVLKVKAIGQSFQALSAEARTKYGKSPKLVVYDEPGQIRGPRSALHTSLDTAQAAHKDPLSIYISTQAPNDADFLSILIDQAETNPDPATVLRINVAHMDLDPFDVETLKLANPAWDIFLNQKELIRLAKKAENSPPFEGEFRNYHLNQRVQADNPFVNWGEWTACAGEIPDDWSDFEIYIGLDLSEVRDLTAMVVVGVDPQTRRAYVKPIFWLPSAGIVEKSKRDRVTFDVYAKQGHLNLTPGGSIDYDFVAKYLYDFMIKTNVTKIAFDRYNWRHFKKALERQGFSQDMIDKFAEFGQGYYSMSPALRTLEGLIVDQRLVHDMQPVLNLCAVNAVSISDDAGNRKLTKKKSTGRIDGMVALAMAVGVAGESLDKSESSYLNESKLVVL